jgi:hypothetical protein
VSAAAPPSPAVLAAVARLLLGAGRSVETRIHGRSMGTAIADGSAIRIEPADASGLRRGDVVAYQRGEEIVAHRLVCRVDGERFVALGDGNWFPDEVFGRAALLGRVVAIDSGEGWRAVPAAPARAAKQRLVARMTILLTLALARLRR